MGKNVKHMQFRTDPETYKNLKIICAERGWTIQTLLAQLVESHIKNAPELQKQSRRDN